MKDTHANLEVIVLNPPSRSTLGLLVTSKIDPILKFTALSIGYEGLPLRQQYWDQ